MNYFCQLDGATVQFKYSSNPILLPMASSTTIAYKVKYKSEAQVGDNSSIYPNVARG